MIGHPREELLLAFQDHRLDDHRRRRLAGHLSGCQRCRNVVQAHRTVRGVFALEAPFAPDGVLERALASRAAGMIIMLPVAEPDDAGHRHVPLRGFLIAAGVILTVVAGVQVVPMTPLKQAWGAWSAMVVDWQPFSGQSLLDINPAMPVAKAAALDPARIRPLTARYAVTGGTPGQRSPRARGDTSTFTLTVARNADRWKVTSSTDGEMSPWTAFHEIGTLRLVEWSRDDSKLGERYAKVESSIVTDSGVLGRRRWIGTPPQNLVARQPAGDTVMEFTTPRSSPAFVGLAGQALLLAAIRPDRGWVGSMTRIYSVGPSCCTYGWATTLVVTGDTLMAIPIGLVDAWAVRILLPNERSYQTRFWIRKSDGLMIKHRVGSGQDYTEYTLESVTYP